MKNIFYYETDIGRIGIAEEADCITNVFILNKFIDNNLSGAYNGQKQLHINETDLLKEAGGQLKEYLNGKRKVFDLPLAPVGTPFMLNVWKCLSRIPYGVTKNYKQIAEEVGNIKACRAVGQANNKNPIPIFIPCHRVIGANGRPRGYSCGVEIQQGLLRMEQQYENF